MDARRQDGAAGGGHRWSRLAAAGIAIVVSMIAVGVGGQELPPELPGSLRVPDALRDYDADGDGRLQRSEAPIALLPAFEAIDQDGDQAIDDYEAWAAERSRRAEEVRAAGRGVARGQATIRQLVQRRDLDGDGLGIDEMPESLRQHFDDLDLNGDGRIDLDEADILAARRRRVEEARQRGEPIGQRGPTRRPEPAAQRGPDGDRTLARIVELMDTDGDGRLQRREAPLRVQRQFERLDANGDGAIDPAEARSYDRARAAAASK